MFLWYNFLTSICLPSVGLEDFMWHMETLDKYKMKALNDSQNTITLLKTKVTQKYKEIL